MSVLGFSREIEVLIGPLQEWKGGGNQTQARRFFANGSFDQLRIKFNIAKHIISTAIPTKIEIYNLSPSTRNSFRESGLQVLINVGWSDKGMVSIFKGSLLNSISKREGADIITTLLCLMGFGSTSRALLSQTWNSGTLLTDIISELANSFPGITVSEESIKINTIYKMGSQGYSVVGSARDSLDKLARSYGFSWWIDSGIFYALEDTQGFLGSQIVINSKNGLLKRAEPMLASPMQIKTGVSINSFLYPPIEPGRFIQLESELNPNLDGEYKVHTVSHVGDSHSDQWDSNVQSWVVV